MHASSTAPRGMFSASRCRFPSSHRAKTPIWRFVAVPGVTLCPLVRLASARGRQRLREQPMIKGRNIVLLSALLPMALAGCATTGSVKRAQAAADNAQVRADEGLTAAQRAQGSADNAAQAAAQAQGSANNALTAAQGAGSAAQAASMAAQSAGSRADMLETRLRSLERWKWAKTHPKKASKKHRARHHAAKHQNTLHRPVTADQTSAQHM